MEKSSKISLHKAAWEGSLDKVPAELLTIENLTKPDKKGWSVIYRAAEFGHLDQIPQHMLTTKPALQIVLDGR